MNTTIDTTMKKESILIVDFGSQYTQLIAKKVRQNHVFSHIIPYHKVSSIHTNTDIFFKQIKGVILSGSPKSIGDKIHRIFDLNIFNGIPILGICFGAQFIAQHYGETIDKSTIREFGSQDIHLEQNQNLLGIEIKKFAVWMSHNDTITSSQNIEVLAKNE